LSLLGVIIGWLRYASNTGVPFFAPIAFRSWCWISDKYALERIMLLHMWIIIVCFVLFGFYIHIIYTVKQVTSGGAENKSSKAALKRANIVKKKKNDWISNSLFYWSTTVSF